MTEMNARPQPAPPARLAALRQDGAPAFLVDAEDGAILEANLAAIQLGLPAGGHLPDRVLAFLRASFHRAPGGTCLARLRPPHGVAPHTFRCSRTPDGALLFAPMEPDADTQTAAPAPARNIAPPRSDTASAPLRFNYETDGQGRFLWISPALLQALGPGAERLLGVSLAALEDEGILGGAAAAQAALAGAQSFSAVRMTIADTAPFDLPFDLEIGGVPLLGADRAMVGVRGFGIAWPRPRSVPLANLRPRADPANGADLRRFEDHGSDGHQTTDAKVINLRGAAPLTASERSAFREIARTLSAAVEGWQKLPPLNAGALSASAMGGGVPNAAARLAEPPDLGDDAPHEPELLDRLPVAVLVQQDGEVVHANGTFLHWTGHEDLDAFARSGGLADALERDDSGQLQLVAASGARLPVDVRLLVAPFRGRNALIYALHRLDGQTSLSTETQRHQERAQARREALHLVPWPLLLLEADGLVLFANAAAMRLLEMEEPELVGAPFLIGIDPQDHPEAWAALDEAMDAPGEHPITRTLRLRTASGDAPLVQAAFGPGGTEDRLVCLILAPEPGVSDAQVAEPLEASVQAPAEEAPAAATAPTLADTTDTAEREIAYLSRLAQLLSERLAGPLNLLLADSPPPDAAKPESDDARAALAKIRAELDDLAALAGPAPSIAQDASDLAHIARAALDHLTPSARRRGVRLRADLPLTAPVRGAEPRLARLVRLIIEDALAASPAGASVTVSMDVEEDGTRLLAVADSGPARDEVAMAQARDPVREGSTAGAAREDRLLRLARLEREAGDLGGTFTLQRGLPQGQIALLRLPAVVNS